MADDPPPSPTDPGSKAAAWYFFIESSIRFLGHTTPPQAAIRVSSHNPYPIVWWAVIEWGRTIGLSFWRGVQRFSCTVPDCPPGPRYSTQTDALPPAILSRMIESCTTVDDLRHWTPEGWE